MYEESKYKYIKKRVNNRIHCINILFSYYAIPLPDETTQANFSLDNQHNHWLAMLHHPDLKKKPVKQSLLYHFTLQIPERYDPQV